MKYKFITFLSLEPKSRVTYFLPTVTFCRDLVNSIYELKIASAGGVKRTDLRKIVDERDITYIFIK